MPQNTLAKCLELFAYVIKDIFIDVFHIQWLVDSSRPIFKLIVQALAVNSQILYSHSIVAGGLLLISYTTRLIPLTLLMISFEISAKKV